MKLSHLLVLLVCCIGTALHGQSLEELKEQKAAKAELLSKEQAEASAVQAEIDALDRQIILLSGWTTGFNGIVGFGFNKSDKWVASPNPDATSASLNIDLTGFANREGEKAFWNNKGIVTKSWSDVDLSDADRTADDDGLFDNGTVDILNLSSLAGYKLSEKFAISALAELNSSIEKFLEPGTLDFGLGATWRPIENMVVVVHPFNYHVAFSAIDGIDNEGAIGTKVRVDLNRTFNIASKDIKWSSTLTSFLPYKEKDPTLFEYTWLNSLALDLWKGIGLGVSFGLRNAEFEFEDTQSYYSVGLSYAF